MKLTVNPDQLRRPYNPMKKVCPGLGQLCLFNDKLDQSQDMVTKQKQTNLTKYFVHPLESGN